MLGPRLAVPPPAGAAPEPLPLVAAVGDEGQVLAVGDGGDVDPERGDVDRHGRPLVVVCPRLGVRPDRERPAGDEHLVAGSRPAGRRGRRGGGGRVRRGGGGGGG